MATRPNVTVTVSPEAGLPGDGSNRTLIVAPVATAADAVPRLYSSSKGVFDRHGYAPGVDLAAIHANETGEQFMFAGIPIATAGVVGQQDQTGNTGTGAVSVAVGSDGALDACDLVVKVKAGGTVGADQIALDISLDGGVTFKPARVGTATSYTIPYVGLVLTLSGTLVEGDTVLTARSTAPVGNSDGVQDARVALAEGLDQIRNVHVVGESSGLSFAQAVTAEMNTFHATNKRFAFARVELPDRHRAVMSKPFLRVIGDVEFSEVGASGDTIEIDGNWQTLGVVTGDLFTVDGSTSNEKPTHQSFATVSGATITLGTVDLVDEVAENVTFTFTGSLTFDATGDTITRSKGNWLHDGFRTGMTIEITGTASNDGNYELTNVTSTVLSFAAATIAADETVAMASVDIVADESKADWVLRLAAEYGSLTSEERISLGLGFGAKTSPIHGYSLRRNVQWAANVRSYQVDLHIPTWRVSDGPLSGFTLHNAQNQLLEYDDRVDNGAASNAGFTSFTTQTNGPRGAFITLDLTRAGDGELLSLVAHAQVVNLACAITQFATEREVGQSLERNPNGTATKASLRLVAGRVNQALQERVLIDVGDGVRVSSCVWTPNPDDVLTGPEATLTGVLDILLNGVLHSINTVARVR